MNYFRRRRILTRSGTLCIAITAMMPSARSKVWRGNTNFWRANTRLATGVRLKASPPQAVLVDFLARRAGICTTRYDHFSPPFLEKHHRPHRCQPWRRSTSLHTEFPMIGLVIVTHGRLADEFRAALEHVMGPQNKLQPLRLGPRTTPNCVEVISSKR